MIVMKFGGTSVQDAEAIDRVAAIVRERILGRRVRAGVKAGTVLTLEMLS